jgi:hypothetical protein
MFIRIGEYRIRENKILILSGFIILPFLCSLKYITHYFSIEHRSEQLNGNHMFESPHPRHPYSASSEFDSSLRHSARSRLLHGDNDVILANDFNHQAFHQPNTRKVTKITPSMFQKKRKKTNNFLLK